MAVTGVRGISEKEVFMEQAVHFTEEKNFDREGYDTCLRRLNYDDRDVVMYENMLAFLWEYAVRPGCLADYRGLLSEYSRWNMQMIRKCYYHLPHDLPYANIRRAYESVIHLLDGKIEEGLLQLEAIGIENFHYDGRAPKLLMTKNGKRFVPVSKLFLLYNYYKVLKRMDEEQAERFKGKYSFAFTDFGDGEHEEHDRFLHEQLDVYEDCIFYPVFERIYKMPWCPADFYMYFEEDRRIPLSKLDFLPGT